MEFRTPVSISQAPFSIEPGQRVFCVGSCFANSIGQRFKDALFPTTVNPYGVMYNPASILHTIQKATEASKRPRTLAHSEPHTLAHSELSPDIAILTLGTNHVYKLKETGEIVDNCQKRPASLFEELELGVDACARYLEQAIALLRRHNPQVNIILTVSPIRYQKYGFHGSQLSKATLLLAIDSVVSSSEHDRESTPTGITSYFPTYEIMNDELRDYRFYAPDMLHPSEQAVDYIWQRFVETYFSDKAKQYLREWKPIRQALDHRPFDEQSAAYQTFQAQTQQRLDDFKKRYGVYEG